MGIYLVEILSPSGMAGAGMVPVSPSPVPDPRPAAGMLSIIERTAATWHNDLGPYKGPTKALLYIPHAKSSAPKPSISRQPNTIHSTLLSSSSSVQQANSIQGLQLKSVHLQALAAPQQSAHSILAYPHTYTPPRGRGWEGIPRRGMPRCHL